jgi:chromosomal replication initiator protein
MQEQEQRAYLTAHTIMRVVAKEYRITFEIMTSRRRTQYVAATRQIAMYLCRVLLPSRRANSWNALGRKFNRDHTTVLHGYRKIERLVADGTLRDQVQTLEQRVRALTMEQSHEHEQQHEQEQCEQHARRQSA